MLSSPLRRLTGLVTVLAAVAVMVTVPAQAAPSLPDATQPVTITLPTDGSKDADQQRTQQGYTFENGEWTGLYIRPGITAHFTITVDSKASNPNVVWAYREAGRVDDRGYSAMRADDGGRLNNGANAITFDTSQRKVGQTLLIRNDTTDPGTVTITNANASDGRPSLGAYPTYTHDPQHPELFWTFVQQLREYVASGVDANVGDLVDDPDLHMDASTLILGRQVYELRAAKLADSLKDIQSEVDATAWAANAYKVTTDRLAFFDRLQGFDETDADTKQKPTRMKIVLEMTSNLTVPSTMFAWFTMYHLPESVWPDVATTVDAAHGWANDHEQGHMMDVNPLIRGEETNNLYALWGRRVAGIDAMKAGGGQFTTNTYHGNAISSQKTITDWLDERLKNPSAASQWGDIWLDVVARFDVLHWFDDYDYKDYNFDGSTYTRELADQVREYGGFGAVLRQVRRDPARYRNVGTVYDGAARAYSDALGYDMSEVMGRFGMPVTDATKEYTAKYPKLAQQIQYFTLDADAKAINGAKPFDSDVTPSLKVSRNADGSLHINASVSGDAAVGFELHADGKPVAYSTTGVFDVTTGDHDPVWTVVAYDVRANVSKPATVRSVTTVKVDIAASDGSDVSAATVTLTPRDTAAQPTVSHPVDGTATLNDVPSGDVTVTLKGYDAIPAKRTVDGYDQSPATLKFTLVPKDAAVTATPRPGIAGTALDDGSLAFTIRPADPDDDVMFTTDGSEPTPTHGTRWTGDPVRITSSPLTVKAIAFRSGHGPSEVAATTFTDNRTVDLYDAIYGPSHGVGNKVTLGVGEYRGAGQLGEVYEDLRSLKVPDGLKVTGFEGENLDGTSYTWTGTVLFVNGYNARPIRSLRIETTGAPKAAKTGTVTFDAGAKDASGTMADLDLYEGIPASIPDVAFTRAGWTATGWKDAAGNAVSPGDTTTSSTALTAVWRRNTYTLVADPNGGDSTVAPRQLEAGADVTLPDAGVRRGYTQTGWKLPDGSEAKPGATVPSLTDRDGATVTIVAVWSPNAATLRFDKGASDAAGDTADIGIVFDKETALPESGFTRTGYTFAGWRMPDDSVSQPGVKVKNLTDAAGTVVTVTAVWRANTYTLRFDKGASDAAGTMADVHAAYDADAPLPVNAFTRTGYTFDGWLLPDGRIADDAATVRNLTTADGATVTLTARWKANATTDPDKPTNPDKPVGPNQPSNPNRPSDPASGGNDVVAPPSGGTVHKADGKTIAGTDDTKPGISVLARTGVAATGAVAMLVLAVIGLGLARSSRRKRE